MSIILIFFMSCRKDTISNIVINWKTGFLYIYIYICIYIYDSFSGSLLNPVITHMYLFKLNNLTDILLSKQNKTWNCCCWCFRCCYCCCQVFKSCLRKYSDMIHSLAAKQKSYRLFRFVVISLPSDQWYLAGLARNSACCANVFIYLAATLSSSIWQGDNREDNHTSKFHLVKHTRNKYCITY